MQLAVLPAQDVEFIAQLLRELHLTVPHEVDCAARETDNPDHCICRVRRIETAIRHLEMLTESGMQSRYLTFLKTAR